MTSTILFRNRTSLGRLRRFWGPLITSSESNFLLERPSFEYEVCCTTHRTLTGTSARADRILPAKLPISWKPDTPVQLTMKPESPGNREPLLVQSMLRRSARKWPNRHAMVYKKDGNWVYWTYKEYEEECRDVAKGFMRLGLERFAGVGIMG